MLTALSGVELIISLVFGLALVGLRSDAKHRHFRELNRDHLEASIAAAVFDSPDDVAARAAFYRTLRDNRLFPVRIRFPRVYCIPDVWELAWPYYCGWGRLIVQRLGRIMFWSCYLVFGPGLLIGFLLYRLPLFVKLDISPKPVAKT